MGNVNQFPWAIATLLLVVFGAFQRVSGYCDVTPCGQLPANADACERHFSSHAEEISRESCSRWGGSGEMAYCCEKNSTESLLSSTYGAELNEFPTMAKLSLMYNGEEFVCGGTIYNKRHILTAAHCLEKNGKLMDKRGMTAKVGRNIGRIEMPNNDYKVEEFFVHRQYSQMLENVEQNRVLLEDGGRDILIHHDIAVLRLDRDIVFGDNVKSLEIAPKGFTEDKYAKNAVIVGWGTTNTFKMSDHVQKTNVAVQKDESCFGTGRGNHPWRQYSGFPVQLLCLGGFYGDVMDPIVGGGDSGGPAICKGPAGDGVLCGITSFSGSQKGCLYDGGSYCRPSVFVEVDYFRDWIEEHAGAQDPTTFHKLKLYGEPAPSRRAAHQVHITSDGGKPCGGTLIAPDTVVTAAQCVAPGQGYTKAYTGVKVTSNKPGGKTYLVKSLNILPGFERTAAKLGPAAREKRMISSYNPHDLEHMTLSTDRYFKNDLAILKLKERMDVDPRTLPELANADDRPSKPTYELSLPRNATRGSGLVQREFNILGRDECVRRMNRMDKVGLKVHVDENVLCGVEKYSGGSTCDRELGGGLICTGRNGKETLCGVQIFRFCQWSIPNGFLDLRKESNWIKKAQNSQLNGAIIPEYPVGNKVAPRPENDEWHPQIGTWYRRPSGFKPSTGSRLSNTW